MNLYDAELKTYIINLKCFKKTIYHLRVKFYINLIYMLFKMALLNLFFFIGWIKMIKNAAIILHFLAYPKNLWKINK